jgi:protein-S-isoprenylcysteine O-methyltransferase Ste14
MLNFGSMQYLILFAGWVAYFSLHSVMASPAIKKKYDFRGYRMVYSLVSVCGLLALLLYSDSIPAAPFFITAGPPRYASLVLTIFGVMIIQRAFRQYGWRGFVAEESIPLQTDGILKYIRHPIYAGSILVIVAFFLFIPNAPTLVSCLCMLMYIPVGLLFEEKKLIALYGDEYIEYRKNVPALFPKLL